MKSRLFTLALCMMLFAQCGGVEGTLQRQEVKNDEAVKSPHGSEAIGSSQQDSLVNEDAAVSIAREDATKAYGSLENYNAVVCEQRDKWLVIFDPQEKQDNVLEYLISKRGGGWILWKEKIAQGQITNDEKREKTLKEAVAASKEEAIAITKEDAITISGALERFNITACELSKSWFFVYELKEAAMGGGKQYLIDKGTGKILYKKYSQ